MDDLLQELPNLCEDIIMDSLFFQTSEETNYETKKCTSTMYLHHFGSIYVLNPSEEFTKVMEIKPSLRNILGCCWTLDIVMKYK